MDKKYISKNITGEGFDENLLIDLPGPLAPRLANGKAAESNH
jgi:hypothetical protein